MGRNATTFPGAVALRIDPEMIRHLEAENYSEGMIIVTGTNGKTTTANLLANILRAAGKQFTFNQAGANLVTGITGALLVNTNWRGLSKAKLALLEVDEATVPKLCVQATPTQAIITNFFRDQLDRYGELDTTVRLVKDALPADTLLVLNADDPLVAQFGSERDKVIYYGVERTPDSVPFSSESREARFCPQCGRELAYALFHYGQLGHYSCSECGYHRPEPQILAGEVYRTETRIHFQIENEKCELALQGYYNLYNALAAYSSARVLGIAVKTIIEGLRSFQPQAGRMETFELPEGSVTLALVKNPVGFNQVIRTVLSAEKETLLLIVINDQAADGRDISWLWDVDFELLGQAAQIRGIVCAGLRAEEMALRLKYAGVPEAKLQIEAQIEQAVDLIRQRRKRDDQVFVLPTYTALQPVRNVLVSLRSQQTEGMKSTVLQKEKG